MNNHPHLSETAKRGLRALHRAVREEMEKKSRLGQYVIVFRNGKTVRMLASEAPVSYTHLTLPTICSV